MRILLVTEGSAQRERLADALLERGYDVITAGDAVHGAELALSHPPDLLVTDLWMPGVSGVQLCRMLREEPRTAHVAAILVTDDSQRRSRFWARMAGAATQVAKGDPEALYAAIESLAVEHRPHATDAVRTERDIPVQHRLFESLDANLFESIIAREIRGLAQEERQPEDVFHGLITLASEIAGYRWLAVHLRSPSHLFVHTHPGASRAVEAEVRLALSLPSRTEATLVADDRAVDHEATAEPIVAEVRGGGRVIGSVAVGPDGPSRNLRQLVSTMAAELGGPLRVASLVAQMRGLAMSDPLTGLPNRHAFMDTMKQSLAALERHGRPAAVVLVDIDDLKRVNATHGHDGGDAVLVDVARVLRGMARRTDVVARWGGEELAIGLSHTDATGAMIAAERVRRAIMNHRVCLPACPEVSVTASFGVAAAAPGEGLEALVARATQAMQLAKQRGRNCCEAASEERRLS